MLTYQLRWLVFWKRKTFKRSMANRYVQAEIQLDCQSARRTRKINFLTNQKGYDNSETTIEKLSARRVQICRAHVCLDIILKVISKRRVQHDFYKNGQKRFGFSLPKAFQRWSRNCRNPSGLSVNWFFVGSYWTVNPAVQVVTIPLTGHCFTNKYHIICMYHIHQELCSHHI